MASVRLNKYDPKNNLIESYDTSATNTIKSVYTYDKNDNLIEAASYFRDRNELSSKSIYKYDENNKQIQVTTFNACNGRITRIKHHINYRYDPNQQLLEKQTAYTDSSTVSQRNFYHYNEEDQLIELESYHLNKRFLYQYDKKETGL